MIKWDGHTHSVFCKHGSGEDTSILVERAIELGFQRYSITEHAPLPVQIFNDKELASEFSLLLEELPDYFKHLNEIKKTYADKIEVFIGLELDYIKEFDSYFDEFLETYLSQLDDIIVSLHMINGKNGVYPIDYSPEWFESELISYYGSTDEVHKAYWSDLEHMVSKKINAPIFKRIGHLGLINKYQKQFPPSLPNSFYQSTYSRLFQAIKEFDWDLDFNVAGLRKELCGSVYINSEMIALCNKLGIKLVFGSDAHDAASVGKDYDLYLSQVS